MPDLGALHHLYHVCGFHGLRFELAWLQYVLAGKLLRLGAAWHAHAHTVLRRVTTGD